MAATLDERTRASLLGTAFAALGALSFGATIAFGRSLAKVGLGAPTVLGIRFVVGASLLLAIRAATRREEPFVPTHVGRLLLLGVVYMVESTLFFMALERGTAAAVSLLFYSYPAIVTLIELAAGSGRPSRRVISALAVSATGSALVVVAGADVSITSAGIALALCSAVTFSGYLVVSDRALRDTDAVTKAAWVALGCGLAHVARGVVTGALHDPSGHLPALVGNGLVTASAFAFMFAGLHLLGPAKTAVVMTLEAFFAIVLAALFLGETIGGLQLAGGVAILAGAAIVASAPVVRPAELVEAGAEAP